MTNHLEKAYEKASTLNNIMNRVPDDLLCKLSPKEIILLTEVIHVAFNAGADKANDISEEDIKKAINGWLGESLKLQDEINRFYREETGQTLTEALKALKEKAAQLEEDVRRLLKAAPSSEFENGVLKEMRKHLEQIIANELDAMRTSPCSSE